MREVMCWFPVRAVTANRMRFGANGQGMRGRGEPAPVAMLNVRINHTAQYIYLGKPPQAREFEVELTLSFAHLRPTGKPETLDSQWNIQGVD
jgi:hypothetical protein